MDAQESAMADHPGQQDLVESALEQSVVPAQDILSTFERVITTHAPILESLLLQIPTHTIIRLYHTSRFLRSFFRSYPTAWKYLSFRLLYPSSPPPQLRITAPILNGIRQSQPYALDQLLMNVVLPFSPRLTSLELDNTAVSGQILISTVLHSRRETLQHLSVRGCKNVSLKYHIIPYLTMFGLQRDAGMGSDGDNSSAKHLALKSLYAYRCRHHRRRPYLSSSLLRKDSDSEPTHELVNLCHKLGIWTDTAWCSTPAGRCFRRKGYVSMRAPHGSPEVWVVFDRLWRSKNWIGKVHQGERSSGRDVRVWEHSEDGWCGEPLGTGEEGSPLEGKMLPAHLRGSHTQFVEGVRCDKCLEFIPERCEQCSILMHCVGCRKTLCASCAYDRPFPNFKAPDEADKFWWAPGAAVSPCLMQDPPYDPDDETDAADLNPPLPYPTLSFHWCCTEPIFSGGGGISIGTPSRDVDQVRAVPLPRGQGWEDPQYTSDELARTFPRHAYGDPKKPNYKLQAGHIAMVKWLLGPPHYEVSPCPRNLCDNCYQKPHWRVDCKSCTKPLCIEHDLRGLRLRICGYRDLALEKLTLQVPFAFPQRTIGPYLRAQIAQPGFASTVGLPYRNQPNNSAGSSSIGPADESAMLQAITDQPEMPGPIRDCGSLSASNSNGSRSSTPSSVGCESPTESPKWSGCQSFFCPQYRSMGDLRQRCTNVLRECTSCSVYVCQDCIFNQKPCNCTHCEVNYVCPNCAVSRKREGLCRWKEEEKAQREHKWREDMKALESILEVKFANEAMEFAGQFFNRVEAGEILEVEGEDGDDNEHSTYPDIDEPFMEEGELIYDFFDDD